jgi:lysozyme family protein
MSGYTDTRKQMPPQRGSAGSGRSDGSGGNILTSGSTITAPDRYRVAQALPSSPPLPAPPGRAGAMPQLSPTQREQLFRQYMQNLGPREGGTANRPKAHDPGGLMHKGISTEFLKSYRKQNPQLNLPADPRQLTAKQREEITRAEYFDRARVAEVAGIPGVMQQAANLPEQLFDSAFLHGPEDAGKFLQKALDKILGTDLRSMVKGKKDYDGIVGSKTRAAIVKAIQRNKLRDVNNEMSSERWKYMQGRQNFLENKKGWEDRKKSFYMPPQKKP